VLTERSDTFVAAEEEEDEEETRWFGLEVVELDDPTISDLEIPAEDGVFVIDVESGSPADDGGIVPGDVIRKIGDRTVEDLDDYREVMRGLEGREKAISVMIQRGEYTQFVAIKPE
jgi:serine protease Do